jgi:DNA sulfur modification protein DndD
LKRIFSIDVENYRQYRGKKKIDFSTDVEKNFTIIQGPNGSGKTNLVNAITWCLYDKELRLSKGSSSIGPINSTALEELEKGETLDMAVRIRLGDERPEYYIQRFLRAHKRSDNEIVYTPMGWKVMYLSEGRDWKEHSMPNILINKLLPEAVSGFFLFDGERLDDFFKTENREGVKQALIDVSQINLIDSALYRLDSVKDSIRRNASGFSSQADSILEKIEVYKNSFVEMQGNLKELEKQKSDTLKRISEIDEQLKDVPWEGIQKLQTERNDLTSKLVDLEEDKKQNEQTLIDLIVKTGPSILCNSAIRVTLDEIEKKYKTGELPPKIREQYIKDLLNAGKCICGTDISKPGPHRASVQAHLQVAHLSQIDEEVREGKFELLNTMKTISNFLDGDDRLGRKIRKLSEDIKRGQERLKEISMTLSKYNAEEIQRLESDRAKLEQLRDDLSERIGSTKADIDRCKSKIGLLETDHKKELRKSEKHAALRAQIDLCEKAIIILEKVKQELIDEIRKIIEAKTKEYFLKLIWKKETFVDVKIDENYSVSVIHRGGWDALGTLSAGERQVLALSFLSALQKVSGFDFPVIIDTPLGRISGEPKDNIAELLPNFLSETQVTMLVTDQEYTESVKSRMIKRIGKEWQLVYDESNDETRVDKVVH